MHIFTRLYLQSSCSRLHVLKISTKILFKTRKHGMLH